MEYPGDTTLSREIQLRILSTFKQTLRLADNQQWEEAHFGCDFMLRLDPAFEPARALKRRMTDDRVVEIDDLKQISDQAGVEPVRAEAYEQQVPPQDDESDSADLALDDDLLTLDLGADEAAAAPEAGGDGFETELDQALSELELVVEPDSTEPQPEAGIPSAVETSDESGGIDRESEQRIVQLLSEGEAAFGREEYQPAIDAWSRIFLIDIDHVEASRLIDKARLLKAEAERELDEILHEGISHLEVGQEAMARDAFNRVLALQPNHLVAKEYLEELESAPLGLDSATAAEAAPAATFDVEVPRKRAPVADRATAEPSDVAEREAPEIDLDEEISPQADPPPRKVAKRSFMYIGTAVLILAVAAGWYLFSQWDRFFPNSAQESAEGTGDRQIDPIERARRLHESGNTAMAISQLERLTPEDSDYAEAQALIAQFEAPDGTGDEAAESAATAALLASLENDVYQAYDERRYLKSSLILDRIAEIRPLSGELETLRGEIDGRLKPLQTQIALIRQGQWEYALPQLWRLLDEKPDDRDVLGLLVDGYFNLGVRDLQRGRPAEAMAKFREALSLAPDDSEVQRLDAFAQAYQSQPQDLRYRIFIKYVPFR